MPSRRAFLTGLLASGLAPGACWADAGSPAYLSAARMRSGEYALIGLGQTGQEVFRIPLPGRGHAAAAHPQQPVAVAFARRPGRFAMVVDCVSGRVMHRLDAPEGHHFYGHGVFSDDGATLFTTENDFDNARGMIGMWDATRGFKRIGVISSGGIGPHDIRLMPDGGTLVVANGGIETHPEAGRQKLNLPEMRPNLSYISFSGEVLEQHAPPLEWHRNSIRHLAVHPGGLVAMACQWQGAAADIPPLLATHMRGGPLEFHPFDAEIQQNLQGYLGSIAVSGSEIAMTGPRGGVAIVTDLKGVLKRSLAEPDICGVAAAKTGFAFTTGLGRVLYDAGKKPGSVQHHCAWDNHMVVI